MHALLFSSSNFHFLWHLFLFSSFKWSISVFFLFPTTISPSFPPFFSHSADPILLPWYDSSLSSRSPSPCLPLSLRLTLRLCSHLPDVREEKETGSASLIGQRRQHLQPWLSWADVMNWQEMCDLRVGHYPTQELVCWMHLQNVCVRICVRTCLCLCLFCQTSFQLHLTASISKLSLLSR